MPRLVNSRTGVTVNVSDETAESLGSAYEPAEDAGKPEEKPTTRRKASN